MASIPARKALARPRSRPKTRTQAPAPAAEAGEPIVLVVKRGALRRFDALKTKAAGLPVDVVWDRRVSPAEDPAAASRPASERRQQPPFTWEVADFLVARGPRRPPSSD